MLMIKKSLRIFVIIVVLLLNFLIKNSIADLLNKCIEGDDNTCQSIGCDGGDRLCATYDCYSRRAIAACFENSPTQ